MALFNFPTSENISKSYTINSKKVPNINHLTLNGTDYKISLDQDAFKEAMETYLNNHTPKLISLTCYNCGASITQKIDDHILKCPYCKSAYLTGINQINSI